MTVISNIVSSSVADGTILQAAYPEWSLISGTVYLKKYGNAFYWDGSGTGYNLSITTQDRQLSYEIIDSYTGTGSGAQRIFVHYGAASNIDGVYIFHDGTAWRIRRFITYLASISDVAYNQGNVKRTINVSSLSGNITLTVYDENNNLIGTQTVTGGIGTYTGALPVNIYNGGAWTVGDAANMVGEGIITFSVDDLQGGGGGTTYEESLSEQCVVTDSFVDNQKFTISIQENYLVSEQYLSYETFANTLTESLVVSDSITPRTILRASVADSLFVNDSVLNRIIFSDSITENLQISDNTTLIQKITESISELLSVSDSATLGNIYVEIITENLAVNDNYSIYGIFRELCEDIVVVTDGLTSKYIISVVVSDSVSISDTIQTLHTLVEQIDDTVIVSDIAQEVSTLPRGVVTLTAQLKSGTITFIIKKPIIQLN